MGKRRVSLHYDPGNGRGNRMSDAQPATESDNESETKTVELTLEQQPPRRRICLTSGDRQVEVEGPDEIGLLADIAAKFWTSVIDPPPPRTVGFSAGSTLLAERDLR